MKKSLSSILIGTSLFIGGCDNPGDLLLDEVEIESPVKVKLIQESLIGTDFYRIEVYDSKDKLRAFFEANGLRDGTKLIHESGKIYLVKDGKKY